MRVDAQRLRSGDKLILKIADRFFMDRNISDLMAILLSDGSMHMHTLPNGDRRYRIMMECVDKCFAEKFREILSAITKKNYPVRKRIPKNPNWSDVYYVSMMVPKSLENELLKYNETFRTKPFQGGTFPNSRIPDEIMSANIEQKRSFLRLYATAEGSVILCPNLQRKWWVINRWVSVRCVHPVIIRQLRKLLSDFGISSRGSSKEIIIKGKENLARFRNEIGFLQGCKVTRKSHSKWTGTEKNKLLGLSVFLYDADKCILKSARSKDDVMLFLKSLLEAGYAF